MGEFGDVFNPWAPLNSSADDYLYQFGPSGDHVYLTTTRPGVPTGGIFGEFGIWVAPIAEAVPVDVKPGSEFTPINLKSKGVLPVAIYSTEDFDASQVDPGTLLFGDPVLIADGKSPVSPLRWSYEDVNEDGLDDLSLKFSMRELVGNEVIGSSTTEGYLAGQTFAEFGSAEIAGREMVRIVPSRSPGPSAVPEPASAWLLLLACVTLIRWRTR
jgi:hypothetical protein